MCFADLGKSQPSTGDTCGPAAGGMSQQCPIPLQKSKVASVRIFGETLKHEAIDDSDNLSRATEVAYEFSVRG
jgi:hypothetical protein